VSEWKDNANVLRDFLASWSRTIGTGCSHGPGGVEAAIRYFARDDGLGKLLAELEQKDKRIADLKAANMDARETIDELRAENAELRKRLGN